MDYRAFQTKLASLAEDEYRDFAKKGTPTDYPFLGVRTPHLRTLAKEIIAAHQTVAFLAHSPQSYEEVTTQGIVVASLPYDEMKQYLPAFIPLIDNWATCDTLCNTMKSVRTHRDDFLDAVIEQQLTGAEFATRFALVALLNHYVVPDYLPVIYDRLSRVAGREEYYIQMAAAWLVTECFIKFPDETWVFLTHSPFPKPVQNKAISKIRDSYRVAPEVKSALLSLRK